MEETDLWFKRKTYGYGWMPANSKGWLVLGLYALFTGFVLFQSLGIESDNLVLIKIVVPMLLATAVLIGICLKKGEEPRWQWVERK